MSVEATKSDLGIGKVDDSPSLGSANLSKEEVEEAISALVKKITPAYLELIAENSNIYKLRDKFINFGKIRCQITLYPFTNEQKLENEKYSIKLSVLTKDLQDNISQDNDAFNQLLVKLKNRIFDLGYTGGSIKKDSFYIVLEKGILETCHTKGANYWHRDSSKLRTSITTCFSSMENWTTQIIDEKKMPIETKEFINDYW